MRWPGCVMRHSPAPANTEVALAEASALPTAHAHADLIVAQHQAACDARGFQVSIRVELETVQAQCLDDVWSGQYGPPSAGR